MGAPALNCAYAAQRGFYPHFHRILLPLFISVVFNTILASGMDSSPQLGLEERPVNAVERTPFVIVSASKYREELTRGSELMSDLDAEFTGFSPADLESQLISRSGFIRADVFRSEIKQLITHYRDGNVKSQKIRDLERKYEINAFPNESYYDAMRITYPRLTLMYPHLSIDTSRHASTDRADKRCPFLSSVIPPIMRHPEFGGFIPNTSSYMSDKKEKEDRSHLVKAHLYWLSCNMEEPLTVKRMAAHLKKRIELSRLPNSERVNILINNGILEDTQDLDRSLSMLDDYIPPILKRLVAELTLFDD